jgi:hypothetical protein
MHASFQIPNANTHNRRRLGSVGCWMVAGGVAAAETIVNLRVERFVTKTKTKGKTFRPLSCVHPFGGWGLESFLHIDRVK